MSDLLQNDDVILNPVVDVPRYLNKINKHIIKKI